MPRTKQAPWNKRPTYDDLTKRKGDLACELERVRNWRHNEDQSYDRRQSRQLAKEVYQMFGEGTIPSVEITSRSVKPQR